MRKNHLAKFEEFKKLISKKIGSRKPQIAIILGSGLNSALPKLENSVSIPYKSIPGFLTSEVKGHKGRFIFGKYAGKNIVIMQGRFHYYEGNILQDIAMVIRILGALGVKKIITTSAVGSVTENKKPGSLLILKDHINFMGDNPLIGIYNRKFGPMFPSMTDAYDKNLRKLALKAAKDAKISASEGVYIAVKGPSFETAAEIKALKILGADVVGMSVVPEVISARQLGMKVLGISWVSNFASGVQHHSPSHEEILETGKKMAAKFKAVLEKILVHC